jgi:hypothetical protein
VLLGLLSSVSAWADDSCYDRLVTYDPAVHIGVGLEMPTGNNSSTYTNFVLKGYLLTMGCPKEIGMEVLGLGISHSTGGNTSLVVSPVSYYIGHINLGPELLIQSASQTNFGITLSYRF